MALVIDRFNGQRLFLGNDIIIQVISAERGRVRFAIEAPPEVRIEREENMTKKEIEAKEILARSR